MKEKLLWVTGLILFIELLDTTILYASFVPIAAQFKVNTETMSLPMMTYIVGTCVFIPMTAWLASRYDRIKIINISLIAFAIFSLLCGLSSELYSFSFFRLLQGIFISICASVSMITLLSMSSGTSIVKTMGTINIPALLGTALGPFVGAIFSYYFSWRFALMINVPICFILLFLLRGLKFESIIDDNADHHFDWLGFLLTSLALIFTSLGLEQLAISFSFVKLMMIILGLSLIIIYGVIWKTRKKFYEKKLSILDFSIFQNKDFLLGSMVNLIARCAMGGLPILMSIILQKAYRFSVIKAGLYLGMIAIAGIVAKFFSSSIVQFGLYRSLVVSLFLTAFSMMALAPLNFWISSGYLWLIYFVFGFNMSLLFTAMNSVNYITIDKKDMANASNIGSMIQQFSIGLGIVFAMGGFQMLLGWYGVQLTLLNVSIIEKLFILFCFIFAFLMISNVLIVWLIRRHAHSLRSIVTNFEKVSV